VSKCLLHVGLLHVELLTYSLKQILVPTLVVFYITSVSDIHVIALQCQQITDIIPYVINVSAMDLNK